MNDEATLDIRIKRVDETLPLPEYKTVGSVAFDLVARESAEIAPQSLGYVPMNVCVATPPGYMFLLAARSSLHKRGLMLANGVGIGDQDFCGNDDEWRAVFFNFTDAPVQIERGDRLVQGLFVAIAKAQLTEVSDMGTPSRGGIGSTGER